MRVRSIQRPDESNLRGPNFRFLPGLLIAIIWLISATAVPFAVGGAELSLSWRDHSDNEEGFHLERRMGSNPYRLHATLGPNVTTFLEKVIEEGETFCYRVRAFNAAGASDFTNEVCAFPLIVQSRGAGAGRITGPGIHCPSDCRESFPESTSVAIAAQPDANSIFMGWSGDPDCTDGVLTIDSDKSCAATFAKKSLAAPTTGNATTTDAAPASEPRQVVLTVARAHALSEHGTGSGRVTSQPAGIDCGSACSARYAHATAVTLTASPTPDSEFVGWSGAPCPDTGPCVLHLIENASVVATFAPRTVVLAVTASRGGIVLGPGIDCGSVCRATHRHGAKVTLRAVPENSFAGWEGSTCAHSPTCEIELGSDRTVSARFKVTSRIGVFRPETGEWFLDLSGTGEWQRAHRVGPWDPTHGRGTPLIGSWTAGSGSSVAIYDPALQNWYLDNGNDLWEGCEVDTCATFAPAGIGGAKPLAGDWHRTGQSDIGLFHPRTGSWYVDNGNRQWDGCSIDLCYAGEHVEIIDLNRTIDALEQERTELEQQLKATKDKKTKKQLKRARKHAKKKLKRSRKRLKKFFRSLKKAARARRKAGVDESAEPRALRVGQGDGKEVHPLAASFRSNTPAVMGAFYRTNGAWEFDTNGNGQWDGCGIDVCFRDFVHQAEDLPVLGDWNGTGGSAIGLFRPTSGEWLLDRNANGLWDGCGSDVCLGPFGSSGDIPVVGQW